MGMLFDRGLFKYDDKVSKYWPEFGQEGKENIRFVHDFTKQLQQSNLLIIRFTGTF